MDAAQALAPANNNGFPTTASAAAAASSLAGDKLRSPGGLRLHISRTHFFDHGLLLPVFSSRDDNARGIVSILYKKKGRECPRPSLPLPVQRRFPSRTTWRFHHSLSLVFVLLFYSSAPSESSGFCALLPVPSCPLPEHRRPPPPYPQPPNM